MHFWNFISFLWSLLIATIWPLQFWIFKGNKEFIPFIHFSQVWTNVWLWFMNEPYNISERKANSNTRSTNTSNKTKLKGLLYSKTRPRIIWYHNVKKVDPVPFKVHAQVPSKGSKGPPGLWPPKAQGPQAPTQGTPGLSSTWILMNFKIKRHHL